MAHLDIATAQQFQLALDQRHRIAALVRNALRQQQLFTLAEEVWMRLEVGRHGRSLRALIKNVEVCWLWLVAHRMRSLINGLVLRKPASPGRS